MAVDLNKTPEEQKEEQEETERAQRFWSLPATYCDTYSVYYWSDKVRIAFGEITGDEKAIFRSAIVMPMDSIEELIKSLVEIQDEMKKREK